MLSETIDLLLLAWLCFNLTFDLFFRGKYYISDQKLTISAKIRVSRPKNSFFVSQLKMLKKDPHMYQRVFDGLMIVLDDNTQFLKLGHSVEQARVLDVAFNAVTLVRQVRDAADEDTLINAAQAASGACMELLGYDTIRSRFFRLVDYFIFFLFFFFFFFFFCLLDRGLWFVFFCFFFFFCLQCCAPLVDGAGKTERVTDWTDRRRTDDYERSASKFLETL